MNLLSLIPGLGNIISTVVKSPTEKAELEAKIKELDIREIEAKYDAQKTWMSNGSLFVSGAIPSMLWMLVLVIFFNFILSPLIQGIFGITIPYLNLPDWYSSMCSTIVLGLFAKKAWDSTDMTVGSFAKKSKYASEAETDSKIKSNSFEYNSKTEEPSCILNPEIDNSNSNNDIHPIEPELQHDEVDKTPPVKKSSSATSKKKTAKGDINDPEYVKQRMEELEKKYLLKD